jgi:uncharacterized protein YlxW (UPF0749 family)
VVKPSELGSMDLEAVLMSLAERERWLKRQAVIEEELETVKKKLRQLEKKRRRLAKEKAKMEQIAANIGSESQTGTGNRPRGGNERVAPIVPIR